jgi:hypothetical protein
MKVITIKQPWATLIAKGYKKYEFRTWKCNYRGDILIHAGKGIDKEAVKRFECYNLEYPTGCILAKATMSDCVEVTESFRRERKKDNELVYRGIQDRNWNGYGFKMDNVEEINPIEINGQLGLWNYEYDR